MDKFRLSSVRSYDRSKFQKSQGWGREFDVCPLVQIDAWERCC